jgi:3-oxoacyl-[acyl-carrier-protein] synthase-3
MSSHLRHIKIEALSVCIPNTTNGKSLDEQTASDLAYQAASTILQNHEIDITDIGGLLFLSSTPDYRSPATAMVLQNRLQLSRDLIAFDVNSAGNAFNQGLQLGHSILNSSNSNHALVLYGETPSKQKNKGKEVCDYGAAILLSTSKIENPIEIDFFTHSKEWEAIKVEGGAYKNAKPQGDEYPYSNLNELGTLQIDSDKINDFQFQAFKELNISHKINTSEAHLITNFLNDQVSEHLDNQISKGNSKSDLISKYSGASLQIQLQELINSSKEIEHKVLSLSYGEGLSASCSYFQILSNTYTSFIKSNEFFDDGDVSHEI